MHLNWFTNPFKVSGLREIFSCLFRLPLLATSGQDDDWFCPDPCDTKDTAFCIPLNTNSPAPTAAVPHIHPSIRVCLCV